jgi:hypothetical protein
MDTLQVVWEPCVLYDVGIAVQTAIGGTNT